MPQSTINGCFFYKASHAQELAEGRTTQPTRVEVIKAIRLSAQQFQHFSANLLRDMPFITANTGLTGYDRGVTRCLPVTTKRNRDGILVNSDGFAFARYAAYVRDIGGLNLNQVPMEHCRKPQTRPAR